MESICSISLDLKGRRDTKWVKSGGMRCKGGVSQIGRAVDVWCQRRGVMGTAGWRDSQPAQHQVGAKGRERG